MVKSFVKVFLVCLVLFTLILIPVVKVISGVQIFNGIEGVNEGIEEEMSVLVDPNSPFFDAFSEANRVNMLVVGVNDNLTDTIMLVSWDMGLNHVDVISVPRDTYYERPGYTSAGQRKINAIYASEGIVGTANAVSTILKGIPINYYAIIDYEAVKAIVDGIGGVPIYVPKAMKYDDPYDDPPLHISIPAGQQVLDVEHAIQYLRFRKGYANGDIGRVQAQQEFIKALFKQCIDNGIVDSAKLITSNIQSDVTLGAATKYALKAVGLEGNDIETYTLPGDGQYIGNTSYYVHFPDQTEVMLQTIYGMNSAVEGETGETADGEAAAE